MVLFKVHFVRLYTLDSSLSVFPSFVEFIRAEGKVSKLRAGIQLLPLLVLILVLLQLLLVLLLIIIIINLFG